MCHRSPICSPSLRSLATGWVKPGHREKKSGGQIAPVTSEHAAAKALAGDGAHIILVARTVGALEELDDEFRDAGGSATLVPLNVKDFTALDRLGATVFERWES
ncbi:MAG TPA: hypothetical protein VGL35_06660 [Rhizomicrobium sp.]